MTGIIQAGFVFTWHQEGAPNIPLEITVFPEDLGSLQVIREPLFPLSLLPMLLPRTTTHATVSPTSSSHPPSPSLTHSAIFFSSPLSVIFNQEIWAQCSLNVFFFSLYLYFIELFDKIFHFFFSNYTYAKKLISPNNFRKFAHPLIRLSKDVVRHFHSVTTTSSFASLPCYYIIPLNTSLHHHIFIYYG